MSSLFEFAAALFEYQENPKSIYNLVKNNDIEAIKRSIAEGCRDWDAYVQNAQTVEMIELFIKEGGLDLNKRTSCGLSLLHLCSTPEIAEYLVKQGLNVNDISRTYQLTPIMKAVINNNYDLVRKLVELGADINLHVVSTQPWVRKDHVLHQFKTQKMLLLLLELGADYDKGSLVDYKYNSQI